MGGGSGGGGRGGRSGGGGGGGGSEITTSGGSLAVTEMGDGNFRIEAPKGMSSKTRDYVAGEYGSKNWWLRDSNGIFADIGRHPGDRPLEITTRMEPGKYAIGTGPKKHGYRGTIEIGPPGSKKGSKKMAPKSPKLKLAPKGSRPGTITEIKGKRYKVSWRESGNVMEPI